MRFVPSPSAALPFVLASIVLTAACGLAYAEVQQALRGGANDPQVALAEDGARALDAGASPDSLVAAGSPAAAAAGPGKVDVTASLSPFLVVYDAAGNVFATNGTFDGSPPVPPIGVLDTALAEGRDIVTWQPRTGVRIAAVVERWRGGLVLAGRSLRLVEQREDDALLLAAAARLAGMALLAVSTAAAWWLQRRLSGAGGRQ